MNRRLMWAMLGLFLGFYTPHDFVWLWFALIAAYLLLLVCYWVVMRAIAN